MFLRARLSLLLTKRVKYFKLVDANKVNNSKDPALEIGCGSGIFLLKYAKKDKTYFGEDVKNLLSKIVDNKLQEVHIYFPDPWPKKKHYENRLLNSTFLKLLYTKMDTNSTLFFKTDHNSYFEWTKSNIEELFNIVKHTNDLEKDDIFEYGGIKKEFEAMFTNENQKTNAILATKKLIFKIDK